MNFFIRAHAILIFSSQNINLKLFNSVSYTQLNRRNNRNENPTSNYS